MTMVFYLNPSRALSIGFMVLSGQVWANATRCPIVAGSKPRGDSGHGTGRKVSGLVFSDTTRGRLEHSAGRDRVRCRVVSGQRSVAHDVEAVAELVRGEGICADAIAVCN